MTFHDWLLQQAERDDAVGALARSAAGDDECGIAQNTEASWKRYLSWRAPGKATAKALALAWKEYRILRRLW
jgi:hypothetical protein